MKQITQDKEILINVCLPPAIVFLLQKSNSYLTWNKGKNSFDPLTFICIGRLLFGSKEQTRHVGISKPKHNFGFFLDQ